MSLKKVIFKDSFYYGITSYLGIIAGVIFTPIYTRAFSKSEYGMMDLINTWNSFSQMIIPLGLPYAILRFYQEYNKKENDRNKNIGTLFTSIISLSLIYIFINEIFKPYLVKYFYNNSVDQKLLYISYGIVCFTIISEYFQSINRIEFRLKRFLFLNLSSFIILVSLGYFFAITMNMRISGFFYAALLSSFFKFLLASILGHKDIKFSFQTSIMVDALKYSFPMVLVLLLYNLTNIIDRVLIQNFLDIDVIGDFSVVNRINGVYKIFLDSFHYAWIPYAISIITKPNRNLEYQKSYFYYILISGILLLLSVLFTKELLTFFAPRYLNTEKYVYMSLITSQIKGIGMFYGLGMLITKKTYYELISVSISVIFNVIVSVFLVEKLGLYGIIFGTLIGVVFYVMIDRYNSRKIANLEFALKNEIITILIILTFTVVVIEFNHIEISVVKGIIIKCAFIFTIPTILLSNAKIRNKFKSLLKKTKLHFNNKGNTYNDY